MATKRHLSHYFQYAAIGSIILILLTLRLPQHSYLWRELHNFGHTPAFGLLAWIITSVSARLLPRWRGRLIHYFIGAVISFGLGFALEFWQMFTPGDADLTDTVRNGAGIASFLLIRMAFDRSFGSGSFRFPKKRRVLLLASGLLILLISSANLLRWSAAYLERENKFPTLADFENWPGRMFFLARNSRLESTPPPDEWIENQSGTTGLIVGYPGFEYPGIELDDPQPDWSDYNYLSFILFSPADTSVKISMTVEDDQHNLEYEDRFTTRFELSPGGNRVEIPLELVREAPMGRQMDMRTIARIKLFFYQPADTVRLYLDDISLR